MAFDEKDYQTDEIEHVSNDSSHDEVAAEAKGGDLSEMPPGYYKSWRFIGSVAAVVFMAQGLYLGMHASSSRDGSTLTFILGYVLPANTITIINADLGPDPNYALIPIVKTLCGGVGLILVGRLSDILG